MNRPSPTPWRLAAPLLLLAAGPAPAAAPEPLETLLTALAAGQDEAGFAALPGITWQGVAFPTDSEPDPRPVHFLRGRLLLAGFGAAALPQGVGMDQVTVMGNEGDASLDVVVDETAGIQRIQMAKFYPSADYAAILQRQMPAARIALMADACATDGYGRADDNFTAFFRIELPGSPAPVFATIGRVEDMGQMGPGTTWFTFATLAPLDQIDVMRCARH